MCGIAGICISNGRSTVPVATLRAMVGMQRHRGPDESGIYVDDSVGLGHSRLSIIDLTSGTQPIHNENKTLWIVYNGEVYNYPELHAELVRKGHRFYTTSDTEVILHLFEEKGPACLEDLNGQFAFAIWNSSTEELFLARDRFGIRPLHYTEHNGAFLFASEIKALFCEPSLPRELDPVVLSQIFTFWAPLPGYTPFKQIKELKPGHYLLVSKGTVTEKAYWQIPFSPRKEQLQISAEETSSRVQELLKEAVRIRLRADVPVGAYLSGGLDSSGITALVAKHFKHDVKSFGIGFEERAFDEAEHQREMASFLNVDHRSLSATNDVIGQRLVDCIWAAEKPLLRTGPIPLLLLSGFVRENDLKVVLTGEGADEVFGGYNIFRETKVRNFWARKPDSQVRPELLSRLYPYIFQNPREKRMLRSFFARGLAQKEHLLFSHLIRWENTRTIQTFFSDNVKRAVEGYDAFEELTEQLPPAFPSWDAVSKAQYLEMQYFLSPYLLSSQGDRVAMANSLEIRLPYLDKNVVEFMGKVPGEWKLLGLNEKHILKRSFRGMLPQNIVNRDKHPYRAPIKQSLLRKELLERYLSESAVQEAGLFDNEKTKRLIKKISTRENPGEIDNMAFTGVLSSQIVYDRFIADFPRMKAVPKQVDYLVDKRSTIKKVNTHE